MGEVLNQVVAPEACESGAHEERNASYGMEEVVVEDWDDVDFDEQYELINEQTNYKINPEKHRLDWAVEDNSVIDIVDRKSGEVVGSVKIIETANYETEEGQEEVYWRCCKCGFEANDFNVIQMHAEREHGKGSAIEKVVGNRSYPYTV